MLDVCLLGTGAMKPLPQRWLTALHLYCNGSGLLIDCGEGTQVALAEAGISPHNIDTICITHFHGDHIAGLPGMLLSMGNSQRTEPVTIIGPAGIENVVNCLRVIAPELPFELVFREIKNDEGRIEEGPFVIDYFKVLHGITCYSYSVTIPRAGKFNMEKATVNNVPRKYWSLLQKGETINASEGLFTPEMILGPERKGIKVVYSTDTRPLDITVKYAEKADLFISEGTYGDEGKLDKALEYGHMTFKEAAELGKKADVKRMWLTHFSPSMMNPEEYIEQAEKILPCIETGYDGRKITLKFDE